MKVYPTLDDFFCIQLDKVKKIIKPLGLLFRAEYLGKISEKIKNEFSKTIPNSFDALKSLTGIGKYGANAILCFGFKKRRPILDSNFIRVYQRVFNIKSITKTPKNDKFLWKFTENILPKNNFIKYNYAILDIGGNICLNRNPQCHFCPLNSFCYYFSRKH
jgi:A/G-specific adenine glycosylase